MKSWPRVPAFAVVPVPGEFHLSTILIVPYRRRPDNALQVPGSAAGCRIAHRGRIPSSSRCRSDGGLPVEGTRPPRLGGARIHKFRQARTAGRAHSALLINRRFCRRVCYYPTGRSLPAGVRSVAPRRRRRSLPAFRRRETRPSPRSAAASAGRHPTRAA
jgi:hypothetical protein